MISKILLISSLILNSFLLIYLFGIIPFLLFLSAVINFGFVFYMKFLIDERTRVQNDFNLLMNKINNFVIHLAKINELEMFYGDETIGDLLVHSKQLINDFYDYEDAYFEENKEIPEEEELDERTD